MAKIDTKSNNQPSFFNTERALYKIFLSRLSEKKPKHFVKYRTSGVMTSRADLPLGKHSPSPEISRGPQMSHKNWFNTVVPFTFRTEQRNGTQPLSFFRSNMSSLIETHTFCTAIARLDEVASCNV